MQPKRERRDQTEPWEHPALGRGQAPWVVLSPDTPSLTPDRRGPLKASTGLVVSATQCCRGAGAQWMDGQTEGPKEDQVGNWAQMARGPCRRPTGAGERLPLQGSPALQVGLGQEYLWV